MKRKIDFICIGASKSGTTTIANLLSRNTNIFIPSLKEVNYFNEFIPQDYSTPNVNFTKSTEWYNSHFNFDKKKLIRGELSPCYLNSIKAVKKIKQYNPDIKLFVILRDPIYRAYSQYLFAIQNGVETKTNFLHALQDKPKKYIGESMYYENLSRYYRGGFKKSQIKIVIYEQFFKDVNKSMEDLFKFLGAEHKTSFNLKSEFFNKGKSVRFHALNRLIGRSNILLKQQKFEKLRNLLKQVGFLRLIKLIKSSNLKIRSEVVNELERDTYEHAHLIFEKDINSLKNKLNLNVNTWGFKENKSA